MRYEVEKVLKNWPLMLFFCVVILLNCTAFYLQCTNDSLGYTLMQIHEKYDSWETIAEEAAALESKLKSAAMNGDFEFIDNHTSENRAIQAASERVLQIHQYEEFRSGLIVQAERMQMLTGSSDSFSSQSLQKGIEAYSALEGIMPEVCFTGGYEQLTEWRLSDVFGLFFALSSAMVLLTMEERAGHFGLLKTTRNGRAA